MTVNSPQDLQHFYPVMKELRNDISFADFEQIYGEAHRANGYEIVGLQVDGQVIAVMGYRLLHDFVHRKHLYIDDLVSKGQHRSKGYGAKLLAYAEMRAAELGCTGLRLCTGVENELGKKFYEKNNWKLRAVVFKKKLL